MKGFAMLLLAGAHGALSKSISNCGAAGDHFSNVQMTLSPDPITRKWDRVPKAFTVTISGDLDEDVTGGSIALDLTAGAFGQSKTVAEAIDFTLNSGLIKAGTGMKLNVGPVQLPYLPGSATVSGTVKIVNTKGEPVACIALNLDAPLFEAAKEQRLEEQAATICSQQSDHLHNLVVTDGADGSSTVTGTLDEALATFSVNTALKVTVLGIGHTVNVRIPVSYAPGIPAGDIKIWGSAPRNSTRSARPALGGAIAVTGKVTATDANGEEIFCVAVDGSSDQKSTGAIAV